MTWYRVIKKYQDHLGLSTIQITIPIIPKYISINSNFSEE